MFISPGDINEKMYINKTEKHLSKDGIKVSRSLPKDTILVVCIGATIGKTALTLTEESATNQQINAIIPNNKVEPHFLYYSLKYRADELPALAGRAAIPIVNKSNFSKFSVLIPPLPEQRAISRALRAVQDAREARLREIALERERKAALMEHLFMHGTRGEAMKQTEIGEMPESWKIIRLGEVFDVQLGKMLSSKSRTGISPRPYLRNANVRWGKIDLSDLSSSAARRLLKRYISLECVVTTITTTITKVQSACSLPRCGENRSL